MDQSAGATTSIPLKATDVRWFDDLLNAYDRETAPAEHSP